jgi:hypothetical protein
MQRLKAKRKKRLQNKEHNKVIPRFLPGDIFSGWSIVFLPNTKHELLQVFLFKICFAYRFGFL